MLQAAFLFGRAVAPLTVERGRGEIVNVCAALVHTCGWPVDVGHDDAPDHDKGARSLGLETT